MEDELKDLNKDKSLSNEILKKEWIEPSLDIFQIENNAPKPGFDGNASTS
jgi:hypothetical protein